MYRHRVYPAPGIGTFLLCLFVGAPVLLLLSAVYVVAALILGAARILGWMVGRR